MDCGVPPETEESQKYASRSREICVECYNKYSALKLQDLRKRENREEC